MAELINTRWKIGEVDDAHWLVAIGCDCDECHTDAYGEHNGGILYGVDPSHSWDVDRKGWLPMLLHESCRMGEVTDLLHQDGEAGDEFLEVVIDRMIGEAQSICWEKQTACPVFFHVMMAS